MSDSKTGESAKKTAAKPAAKTAAAKTPAAMKPAAKKAAAKPAAKKPAAKSPAAEKSAAKSPAAKAPAAKSPAAKAPAAGLLSAEVLAEEILATWHRHQEILMLLLEEVPDEGLAAKPFGSRGRDVARQFLHLDRVRRGWLHHHETGEHPDLPRYDRGPAPPKDDLREALEASGAEVEAWLEKALRGEVKPRMFGKKPLRWLGYLISHESHHRGSIALALKQSGCTLPEKVAVNGLWGKWIFGK